MKKFLLKLSLFGAIIILLLAGGEWAVRWLDNPYKTKDRWVRDHAPEIKTVILGSSHTLFGVDPTLLGPGAVNLANISQTLRYDRLVLEHYLPMLDSLRNVVIQFGYTSLYDRNLEEGSEWHLAANYRLYMGLDRHSLLSHYGFELSDIDVYSGKLGVFLGLKDSQTLTAPSGQGLQYSLENKNEDWFCESGPVIAQRHTSELHPERRGENISEIERIDSLCRSKGARLIIVTMPEWETYRSNVDVRLMDSAIATVDSLARSRGITYLNFYEAEGFVPDDFYDADHLSSDVGARKLTLLLRPYLR